MNIEHEYYDATEMYEPFAGICLVDTFDLASEDRPQQLGLGFMAENFARLETQQKQNVTVVIGNPPYNMGQANENDNNKNRKYLTIDERVRGDVCEGLKGDAQKQALRPVCESDPLGGGPHRRRRGGRLRDQQQLS